MLERPAARHGPRGRVGVGPADKVRLGAHLLPRADQLVQQLPLPCPGLAYDEGLFVHDNDVGELPRDVLIRRVPKSAVSQEFRDPLGQVETHAGSAQDIVGAHGVPEPVECLRVACYQASSRPSAAAALERAVPAPARNAGPGRQS